MLRWNLCNMHLIIERFEKISSRLILWFPRQSIKSLKNNHMMYKMFNESQEKTNNQQQIINKFEKKKNSYGIEENLSN